MLAYLRDIKVVLRLEFLAHRFQLLAFDQIEASEDWFDGLPLTGIRSSQAGARFWCHAGGLEQVA